jgi:hypothetical protein
MVKQGVTVYQQGFVGLRMFVKQQACSLSVSECRCVKSLGTDVSGCPPGPMTGRAQASAKIERQSACCLAGEPVFADKSSQSPIDI